MFPQEGCLHLQSPRSGGSISSKNSSIDMVVGVPEKDVLEAQPPRCFIDSFHLVARWRCVTATEQGRIFLTCVVCLDLAVALPRESMLLSMKRTARLETFVE